MRQTKISGHNGGDVRLDHPSMVNTLSDIILRCADRAEAPDRRLRARMELAEAVQSSTQITYSRAPLSVPMCAKNCLDRIRLSPPCLESGGGWC
jgi:hypothetical protein